jgi:hypothetical protein
LGAYQNREAMMAFGQVALGMVLGVFIAVASPVDAAVDPVAVCKDKKFKAAGKKTSDFLKAYGKNAKKPDLSKLSGSLSKVQSKFTKSFAKADAEGSCPFPGDDGNVELVVDDCADQLASIISNGTRRSKLPATGQTTCWDSSGSVIPCAGTGQDGEIQAGKVLAYVDNGDGTITDLSTGIMWEKKSDDGSIHDVENDYTWSSAFAVHVAGLNGGGGFAGYTDWRLPNVKELQSIVDYERGNPSIDPAFNTGCVPGCTVTSCSCTESGDYWSSTTRADFPDSVWYVDFITGHVDDSGKGDVDGTQVRAVRGGL